MAPRPHLASLVAPAGPLPLPKPAQDEQQLSVHAALKWQISYYFSSANLETDQYMKDCGLGPDCSGRIDTEVVAGFARLKAITRPRDEHRHHELVLYAMRSLYLTLKVTGEPDADGKWYVSRTEALGTDSPEV